MIEIQSTDLPSNYNETENECCSRCGNEIGEYDSFTKVCQPDITEEQGKAVFTYCSDCVEKAGYVFANPFNSLDEFWNFEPEENTH